MQEQLNLKPAHKLVKSYYETLGQLGQLNFDHEGAVRGAFQALLKGCGRQFDWELIAEYQIAKPKARPIRVDGAMVDPFHLARGFWEAKDEHDDLEKEIRSKFERGYPKSNIIFQAPEKAILFQNGVRQGLNEDIRDGGNLVELLKVFFAYREPHHEEWDEAVAAFKERIPAIAQGVKEKIEAQRRNNPAFVERFEAFYEVCRQSINPNLSVEAVETMLIQHLMTERIFRRIFDNPDFTRRNVIALEIEKVIDSMTAKTGNRNEFLKGLDHFYRAIELAAESTQDYTEKQQFMNSVYERFFQGFSPKEADTHGIVYTPQPIVDFMVRSVEDILQKEFGRSLSDKGVHILDPFVGTGNFITRVMKEIKTTALPYKYENELHCNEVMLLPYYVASMNIEHEYLERTGEYQPFPGICLVDTFELAEPEQSTLSFMSEENTARVKRQKEAPIFVIIANPPYNVGQLNENDNNKNRKYKELDRRVAETYGKESNATNKNALSDVYVKAFRWASDRLEPDGIVVFVSNNGFLEAKAFDGMRHELRLSFTSIYHLNLRGDARTTGEQRRKEGGNIFQDDVRVGVGITILVKNRLNSSESKVFYYDVGDYLTYEKKRDYLESHNSRVSVPWTQLQPDNKENWLTEGMLSEFAEFLPCVSDGACDSIFATNSNGVKTNRDSWVYNFNALELRHNVQRTIEFYNSEILRWRHVGKPKNVDGFVRNDDSQIAWSSDLKLNLQRENFGEFSAEKVRGCFYRPFVRTNLYFDRLLDERVYGFPRILPTQQCESENRVIWQKVGTNWDLFALAVNAFPDVLPQSGSQCLPFYTYDEDGSNRRENITDWAVNEFRTHYSDPNITKWDIFHYVYAVLHHPEYRERYAANLKRELPRIPFVGSPASPTIQPLGGEDKKAQHAAAGGVLGKVGKRPESLGDDTSLGHKPGSDQKGGSPGLQAGDKNGAEGATTLPKASAQPQAERPKEIFRAFADAGKRLADLHVNYERQPEYRLERVEKGQLNWRVEKMRLSKDKTTLVYNEFLTLKGIPPETYEYRLGNRSALEWVIDQYQVSTDKRSGITNDPNRADDPEYILRLIGQVITVSLETMKIVKALPQWAVDEGSAFEQIR